MLAEALAVLLPAVVWAVLLLDKLVKCLFHWCRLAVRLGRPIGVLRLRGIKTLLLWRLKLLAVNRRRQWLLFENWLVISLPEWLLIGNRLAISLLGSLLIWYCWLVGGSGYCGSTDGAKPCAFPELRPAFFTKHCASLILSDRVASLNCSAPHNN